jgi:hypothetical protein
MTGYRWKEGYLSKKTTTFRQTVFLPSSSAKEKKKLPFLGLSAQVLQRFRAAESILSYP